MIEKNIIQTTPAFSNLNDKLLIYINQLKCLNPDWTYRCFYQQSMVQTIRDFGFDTSRINPEYGVVLADIFRLIALYKFGGVYLDIKSTATTPLDDILGDRDYLFVKWPQIMHRGKLVYIGGCKELLDRGIDQGEVINWFIASKSGNPVLLKALEYIERNINSKNSYIGKPGVLRFSGPVPFTHAVFDAGLYYSCDIYKKHHLRYTVLPTHKSHFRLNGVPHYSTLTTEVVLPTSN